MKKWICAALALALAFALCACGHTAATCETFIAEMQNRGYTIEEMDDAPEGGRGYAAHNEDNSFVVYFYETGKEVYAINAYSNDMSTFKAISGGGSSSQSSAEGFGCATRKTAESFLISAYIGDTYMYGETTADQADAMKDVFKAMGYK